MKIYPFLVIVLVLAYGCTPVEPDSAEQIESQEQLETQESQETEPTPEPELEPTEVFDDETPEDYLDDALKDLEALEN